LNLLEKKKFEIKKVVEAIGVEKIPAKVSNTAGTFLCNFVMYEGLDYSAKHGYPIKVGFIHVPYIPEQVLERDSPSMALDNMVTAIEATIRATIEEI
jgi:pyroglutamyl-peptidase